jgi:hypothetical protein
MLRAAILASWIAPACGPNYHVAGSVGGAAAASDRSSSRMAETATSHAPSQQRPRRAASSYAACAACPKAARTRSAMRRDSGLTVTLRARAGRAGQFRAQVVHSAGGRQHPGAYLPWWSVTHVLDVPAL